MHFTLAAKNEFACKTLAVASSFLMNLSPGPQVFGGGNSRRSHTHGSSRNRIALHVMLNGRRNSTRC